MVSDCFAYHGTALSKEARELLTHNKKAYVAKDFPNATGDKTKPKEIFGKKITETMQKKRRFGGIPPEPPFSFFQGRDC